MHAVLVESAHDQQKGPRIRIVRTPLGFRVTVIKCAASRSCKAR